MNTKDTIKLEAIKGLSREDLMLTINKRDFFKREPYHHQLVSLLYSYQRNYTALFMEMGTGKSKVVIDWLRLKDIKDKILIVTVNEPLCYNWTDELKMNSDYSSKVLLGVKEDRLYMLSTSGDCYIINYAGLDVVFSYLYDMEWNAVILDESRKIKNLDAKRTKYSILLGRKAKHRAILTGTPLINPLDIFAQFLFLDDGKTFGKFFGQFKRTYFIKEDNYFGAKWIINPDMIDEYLDRIFESSVWYSKDECLDLPEKVHQVISVRLGREQTEDYEKLSQGFGDLNITNMSVLELENKFIKCSQITSGFIKDRNGDCAEYPDNNKLDTLMDLVETALECTKVVIFHNFVHDAHMIEKELKKKDISFASLRGEIKNKDEQYKGFINNDNVKVMVAHPQSGGMGLNFTVASVCIYYSLSYDVESLLQSQDRLHRIGQKHKVIYYYLICAHTIDVSIKKAFEEKKNFITMVKGKNLDCKEIVRGKGE